MTGEGWRLIMNDLKVNPPYCTNANGQSDCGSSLASTAFFVSYVILCTYILTNLFVATILDYVSFGILKGNAILSDEHLDKYQEVWSEFDKKATGFIPIHHLWEFLDRLGAPLAQKFTTRRSRLKFWWEVLSARQGPADEEDEYEQTTVQSRHTGLPLKSLLEILLMQRLGMKALTSDVLSERMKEVEKAFVHGAATTIQSHFRGYSMRTNYWKKMAAN